MNQEFKERRESTRDETFRRYNGFTEKLYKTKNFLYLKATANKFSFATSKDTEVSILRAVNTTQPLKLILDLESIEKIDSAGLGVLIHLQSELTKNGCEVILMNINVHIKRAFVLMGIVHEDGQESFFKVINSLEEL